MKLTKKTFLSHRDTLRAGDRRTTVLVGMGTCGIAAGANDAFQSLKKIIELKGLDVDLKQTGCLGLCFSEPTVEVRSADGGSTLYGNVDAVFAEKIATEHLINGTALTEHIYETPSCDIFDEKENPLKQTRIVLRNCGVINPEKIDEYIAREGYSALAKVIFEMTPNDVLQEIKDSGLRGRGGGGFPCGTKWGFSQDVKADQKYIVCNADEGDPGAYMDRSILECDPHSVLEAMAIAGYTVGANQGFIYIRVEYPLAIERLNLAIAHAKEKALLGDNILGSDFSFDIEIRLGAGSFVCGEETALIASLEGKRGMPIPRPPFPAVRGLWGKPTVINNVETWANIPMIILKGSDWFTGFGTQGTTGTKVFAVSGKIKNCGLVEVPMGTTLRTIIYDICGGINDDAAFKAVQTGGPSGGCITTENLDMPIDYDSLKSIGSMMGSGGMIVMDENDCMVDVAKFFLNFTMEESCGKCTPCRIGSKHLHQILERITDGKGEPEDIERMVDIGNCTTSSSLCGLGQTFANPVMSTLKNFREEYEAHIYERRCPACSCQNLFAFKIDGEKCTGCTACARVCPVKCIDGKPKEQHEINQKQCIKCGQCFEKCKLNAVLIKGSSEFILV